MDRRAFLRSSGCGLLAGGVLGCGTRASHQPGGPILSLATVRASWERVIRTTVGLRPFRPGGFVLRADSLGDKLLIHNYGHGGAGMSLSWGTAHMAADLALEREDREAAVLGCGVVGLTTARQLQRRGFRVTIYAQSVPPDTTSNRSFAQWTPTSGLVEGEGRTPRWEAQFRRAAELAFGQLQQMVGSRYGVSWIDTYALRSRPPSERGSSSLTVREPLLPETLSTGAVVLGPGEHPFPSAYATQRATLRIEPSPYLDALVEDFLLNGGRIVIREFRDRSQVAALDEAAVVNCTGLGARRLFGDDELIPVKGQLTMLVPQPEVNWGTFGGIPGSDSGTFVHMQPRRDGIVLGGTTEEGEWSLEPDEEARRRIVRAHIELFAAMGRSGPAAR